MASEKKTSDSSLKEQLAQDFHDSKEAYRVFIDSLDDKEEMLLGRVVGTGKKADPGRVAEGSLAALIRERSARVTSQLPTGKVQAMTKKDRGKSALMNLILTRYVQPNANAQHDHLTKLRLWDHLSMVYGAMPMLYDFRVDNDYVGPDCWLIHPRNFFPQPGKHSIQDSDWAMVSTIVTVPWLEAKLESKAWDTKAIKKLLKMIEEGARPGAKDDSTRKTIRQEEQDGGVTGRISEVEIVTRYESGKDGHWITFCPDFDNMILRDMENPHKTGRIPIVMKYAMPLIDDIWGLGYFELGASLQRGVDTLVNMYLTGEKFRIAPPMKINLSQVTAHTIRLKPNAKWSVKSMDAVQPYNTSPQGVQGFQAAYGFMKSAMLNQNGTTDTSVNQEQSGNPSFGKTPEALKQQALRESTLDAQDRFYMEKAIEELYEGFVCLIANKSEKPIDFLIFEEEIRQLVENGMEDVVELYESSYMATEDVEEGEPVYELTGEGAARVVAPRDKIKGKYKYIIDAGTTMAKDDIKELENLIGLADITFNPGMQQLLMTKGKGVDAEEFLKKLYIKAGITDWEKIITDAPQPQQDPAMQEQQVAQEQAMQEQMAQEQAMQQQMMAQQQMQQQQFIDPQVQAVAQQILGQ